MSRAQRLQLRVDDVIFAVEGLRDRIRYPDTKREKVVVVGHLINEAFTGVRDRLRETIRRD